MPGPLKKLWSFTAAWAKFVAAGSPARTEEEVSAILKICQACPHYQPTDHAHGICGICGCGCSNELAVLTNKIRMGTEHCVDEPARW